MVQKEPELLLPAPPPPPALHLYNFSLLFFSGGCVLLLLAYLICAFVFVSFYQKHHPVINCIFMLYITKWSSQG